MNQNFPWEKVARYFAGELTGEEEKKMESWMKTDPEREKKVKYLYQIWEESGVLPYRLDVDEAWQALSGKITHLEGSQVEPSSQSETGQREPGRVVSLRDFKIPAKKTGSGGKYITMIAASVLIILTAGFFAHNYYFELQETEAAEVAVEELTTRDGERAIYTLSDGSRVTLHSGSRVEVPVNYNDGIRELFLEGEAYFETVHNPEKPFIVRSGNAYTRVLGTKFLVQAWPERGRNIEVIVEEGRVALGAEQPEHPDSQNEMVIIRHQKGVFSPEEGVSVSDITDLHWHIGWTEGRLVFEDRQLSEILPRLERWYAVNIRTEDSAIDEIKLTAEINYSQPMMEVLTGIALSLDLEIERENRTYTFRAAEGNKSKHNT